MGLFFAWAIGEGIITARWVKQKAPPPPGALLLPTGLFLALAILSEYRPARPVAVAFAFAVDLAITIRLFEQGNPKVQTGWPPPAIPATQIWPGGRPAGPAAASQPGKQPAAARAASGFSLSGTIQKVIQFLPGFGPIK